MRIKEGDTIRVGLWSIYYSAATVHFEHARRGIVWKKKYVTDKDTRSYFREICESASGTPPAEAEDFCQRWALWPVFR